MFIMPSSLLPFTSTFTTSRVSCNGASDGHNDNQLILPKTDRRSLLVGLGGLYTATSLTSLHTAIAAPITTPDITSTCIEDEYLTINNMTKDIRTRKCCPPSKGYNMIKPFMFPNDKTVRMRWPAHRGTLEQVDKYRRAVQAMKDLPDDHPHSFIQQAKVHCAYCDGYYTQLASGFPYISIHIHNSWLFLPFHRWHLYFHERILGKLINDPTFALPFWKWDEPDGMRIPDIFIQKDVNGKPNPLYDVYRDARHIKQVVVDLEYDHMEKNNTNKIQIAHNLCTVYRDLVRNGVDATSFFGGKYVAGDSPIDTNDPSVGSLEGGSHNAVHRWVGDAGLPPNYEDMGSFYSAAYDPLFYTHHTNLDRLWKLWKDLGIPGHKDPSDINWLNASYVFYDENEQLVRVYNKDSINLDKLKYDYIESSEEALAWHKSRPAKRSNRSQVEIAGQDEIMDRIRFPVRLNKVVKVRVKRPGVDRTEAEKAKANEVLVIKRIKYGSDEFVKFDVFVNGKVRVKEGEMRTACDPEYAGGFAQIPHNMKNVLMSSSARFGLNELLADTNTEDEEYVTVTLVPRTGCSDLMIGEIKIELVPIL